MKFLLILAAQDGNDLPYDGNNGVQPVIYHTISYCTTRKIGGSIPVEGRKKYT